MKTITIFDVQEINSILNSQNYDYHLKMTDACGSPSLTLQCQGKEKDIQEICQVINDYLIDKHLQVIPGTINPLLLQLKKT